MKQCAHEGCTRGEGGTRKLFLPKQHPGQRYCCRGCAQKALPHITRMGAAAANAAKAAARRGRLANTPPEKLEREGYAKGYQAARHRYHYRSFLKQLAALLAAVVASDGQGQSPTQ